MIRSTAWRVSDRCCWSSCRRRSRRASNSVCRVSACSHAAFRPLRVILDLGGGPANLLVGLGKQFGQRQFDVVGDPVHLGEPFGADLVEERPQSMFVQPG